MTERLPVLTLPSGCYPFLLVQEGISDTARNDPSHFGGGYKALKIQIFGVQIVFSLTAKREDQKEQVLLHRGSKLLVQVRSMGNLGFFVRILTDILGKRIAVQRWIHPKKNEK